MAELSGLEVCVLVKEIGERLLDTYVNNIYSLGETQIFRFRKSNGEEARLVVSPRLGAWISEAVSERAETTEFTTRLRGELVRSRFAGVNQVGLDRIYELSFAGRDRRKLVVELMPPGNLAVLDGEGQVILALRSSTGKRNRFARGVRYSPPEQKRIEPSAVTGVQVRSFLSLEPTAGRAVGKHVALPRKYVMELLFRLGVDENTQSERLIGRSEEVAAKIREIVEEAVTSPFPCACNTPFGGEEVFAIKPAAFAVKLAAGSMSELCDRMFGPVVLGALKDARREEGESKRGELQASMKGLEERAAALTAQAKELRAAAERAASARTVDEAISELHRLEDKQLIQRARSASSPAAVASAVYDRVKELGALSREAAAHAEELKRRLERFRVVEKAVTKPISVKKKEWFEQFRWFLTSSGRLAVGGRDAQSNSLLIRRHLEVKDTVYHADLFGSPFFILKNGSDQTEQEVLEVAQATVSFSSAWKTGLASADAYWVSSGQVATAAPSGEYLPRGSFVIKGKKNFVRRLRVELAVGLDSSGRLVSGPESAVSLNSECYVILVPHREKASDTAKKVLRELTQLYGREAGLSLDEVVRSLPSGGGKIVRKKAQQRNKSKQTLSVDNATVWDRADDKNKSEVEGDNE